MSDGEGCVSTVIPPPFSPETMSDPAVNPGTTRSGCAAAQSKNGPDATVGAAVAVTVEAWVGVELALSSPPQAARLRARVATSANSSAYIFIRRSSRHWRKARGGLETKDPRPSEQG